METSIDEGLETEGVAEEDPSQAFGALQSTRSGQRRHTLSEVTDQLVAIPGSGMMHGKLRPLSPQHQGTLQSLRSRNGTRQFLEGSLCLFLYEHPQRTVGSDLLSSQETR